MHAVRRIILIRREKVPQHLFQIILYIFIIIIRIQSALLLRCQSRNFRRIIISCRNRRCLAQKRFVNRRHIISKLIKQFRTFNFIGCSQSGACLPVADRIFLHGSVFKSNTDLSDRLRGISVNPRHKSIVFIQRKDPMDRLCGKNITVRQLISILHPHSGIRHRHQPGDICVRSLPRRAVCGMVHHNTVIGNRIIVFPSGEIFQCRKFSVNESVQIPDFPVKSQNLLIEVPVIDGICLLHMFPVLLGNIRTAVRSGIFVYFHCMFQHIKPGNPVTVTGTHTQAVFDQRLPRIRPADQSAIPFFRRGEDSGSDKTSPDRPAAMPARNPAGPCTKCRMVIRSLHLPGHRAVFDQCAILGFSNDSSDCYEPLHRDVHRCTFPDF